MNDAPRPVDESVRWQIFRQTVDQARQAFADVPPDDLQKMIDEAVEEVRAQHYFPGVSRAVPNALAKQ